MLGTEGKLKRGKEGSVSFCLDTGGVCAVVRGGVGEGKVSQGSSNSYAL